MTSQSIGARDDSKKSLHVVAIMLSICVICLLDSLTTLHITIAVLYVLVLFQATNVLSRNAILILGCLCIVLTFVADLNADNAHSANYGAAWMRCLISSMTIAVATYLVLRNQAAAVSLADQIRILEQTHDAIIVRDMEYRITHWNQGACKLFGWSSAEALGQTCYSLLSTDGQSPLKPVSPQLLHSDRWEGEEIYDRRDGVKLYVSSRWTVRRDARGVATAIISASNDITAFRQAEEALSQSQAQLAHATRITMLGELMASIAHEINQPLAAISTYGAASLRWLERDSPDIAEASQAVGKMISDSKRASEVIRRIRALSRKSDAVHAPLDLNATVDESLALLTRELARKNISLVRDLALCAIEVTGDRVQLQQVVINLIINSVQAINGGSTPPREIIIRTRRQAGRALMTLIDSGPGFPSDQLPHLFDAFFTTKREGMGLGLSICKSIVESHAGEIKAQNRIDRQGAFIQISLPVTGAR
jgi:PAS domain S-box-containing protein